MPTLKNLKTLFRAKQATGSLQTTAANENTNTKHDEDQRDQAPVPNDDLQLGDAPSWTSLPSPPPKDMIARPNTPVPPTPFSPKNETEREMVDDLRRLSILGVCGGGGGEEAVYSCEHDLDDTSSIASSSENSDGGSPRMEFKISRITFLQFSPGSSSVLKESPTYYKSTLAGKPVNARKAGGGGMAVPESPCASRLERIEKEKGGGVASATSAGDDEGEEDGEAEAEEKEKDDDVIVGEISSRFIEVFSDSSEEEKAQVSSTSSSDEDEPEPVTAGTDLLGPLDVESQANFKGLVPSGEKLACPTCFTSAIASSDQGDEPEPVTAGTDLLGIPYPNAQINSKHPSDPAGELLLPCPTSLTSTLVSKIALHPVKLPAPLSSSAAAPATSILDDSCEDSEAAPYDGIAESPILYQDSACAGEKEKRGLSPSLSSLASLVSIAVTLNSVGGYNKLPDDWTFEQKIAFVEEELQRPFYSLDSSQATFASRHSDSPRCTSSPTTSTQTHAGSAPYRVSLSDLQILRVLGKGATSQVYMVRHKKWNTRHALKVAMNIYDEKGKERKSAVEWLKGEQGVMRKIGGQGGWFLRLDASWSDTRNLYLLLPLYATDLDSEIQRCHVFPVRRARFYFAQLTIALHDLHSRGIIHRDVKPANIMLGYEGNIVLGDFGLSEDFGTIPTLEERTCQPYWPYWSTDVINQDAPQRPVDTLTFALTKFCGSPHHLAPEVWLEKPYAFGVDWWAAATVLFNMVTGGLPFWTSPVAPQYQLKAKVVSEDIYFRHGEKLDFWTKDILWKMLKKKPEERLPIMDVQSHPFFDKIDWDAMTRRVVTPPFIPPRQPTHVINDRIVEFVRGNAFAEGGNPHPELEYSSSTMITGMFEEKEKMRESDFDKDDLVGASPPKVQVLHHHELGLWGKICESSQEGIAFSMYYPPPVPAQRFYVNQDSVAAAYKAVMKNMDGAGMDDGSYDDGSSFSLGEQLGQWKDRIKCVFVPRARSRPVDEPRFDLLD